MDLGVFEHVDLLGLVIHEAQKELGGASISSGCTHLRQPSRICLGRRCVACRADTHALLEPAQPGLEHSADVEVLELGHLATELAWAGKAPASF